MTESETQYALNIEGTFTRFVECINSSAAERKAKNEIESDYRLFKEYGDTMTVVDLIDHEGDDFEVKIRASAFVDDYAFASSKVEAMNEFRARFDIPELGPNGLATAVPQ